MPIKSLCYKKTIITKNVSRNKLLLCFKPVVDMDQLLLDNTKGSAVDQSNNQPLKHLGRGKREDMKRLVSNNKPLKHLGRGKREDMKRLVSNSSSLSDDNSSCSTIISSSKNSLILRSPKKNFSRVIKAVFFETIMLKRVRDGKGSQCQEHSNGSKYISSSSAMNSKRTLDDTSDHQVNEANLVRSCSSSISEPRKLSRIKKNSKNPNQELEFKARNMDESGIYLLLMSLTVLILWGKICAIFCNLIWLYFLPRRRHNTIQPENVRTSLRLLGRKESKEISTATRRRP